MSFVECPNCGSTNTAKRGWDRTQKRPKQRYKCHDCNKRFNTHYEQHRRVPRVLVLDIETSPLICYTWGIRKQFIHHGAIERDWHLLTWAAKWLCEPDTLSDSLTPSEAISGDDKRICKSIWKLLDRADVVIAHNGDRFDMPRLNTRFLYYKMGPPMPYQTIDTLKQAYRNFSMTSNKQDYITKFLQLPEKLKTEFGLWVRCINGEQAALNEMLTYNRQDVAGLEDMYFALRPWMKSHPNMGIFTESEVPVCPACGRPIDKLNYSGRYTTPAGSYKAFRCKCGAIGRERSSQLTAGEKARLLRSVAR